MPGYVEKLLLHFNHEWLKQKQHSPHLHVLPTYGAKAQYAEDPLPSPSLSKDNKKYVQAVTGTLLYYGRAVDPMVLTVLNAIAMQQASPTDAAMSKIKKLLHFVASQEEAVRASDMVLAVHSDAGYLNESKARSWAGGHFFLTSDVAYPPNNGAILDIAQIIDAVMSSAAKAELGALFINAWEAVHIRQILAETGHPQPKTPIQTDNSMAEGVINSKIQPKWTKSIDMRFECWKTE